jgi:CubicO group peptidase (beta-lactamase class C family)
MSAERLGRITEHLRRVTADGAVMAASVMVARHGKLVLHEGLGRLKHTNEAPRTEPDTVYLLASISKPVTVCGLMLLVERGLVVLGDRVGRYLPDFQGAGKEKVLVRDLVAHTSGLPDMLPENRELRVANAPLGEFVAGALRTPLLYEPRTDFAYQSMGTLLAGEIVERVSGSRLRDFLRREIFEPLGMRNSVLGLDGLKISETAWVQEGEETDDTRNWGPNSPYWRDQGHPWGGMHSTTGDLARLMQAFLNGGELNGTRLFAPTTTAAMIRDQNTTLTAPWGLGWGLRDSRVWNYFGDLGTQGTFGHVGATGTVAWADPRRNLVCVLLTTRPSSYDRGALLNQVSNLAQAAVVEI